MNTAGQTAAIVLLAALAGGGTWWLGGPPDRDPPCDPAALEEGEICLDQVPAGTEILWVDARSREDWRRNGMPGSLLWNLDAAEDMHVMEAEVAMKVAMTPTVVVYCGDENCGTSQQIARRIRDLGLGADVHVLHGGWRTLQRAGLIPPPTQTP